MVWQTVTILILSCVILVLTAVSILGFWSSSRHLDRANQYEGQIANMRLEAATADGLIAELRDSNERLRGEVQRIPLTAKPKQIENAQKQPRTSAEVRKLTERAFGQAGDNVH